MDSSVWVAIITGVGTIIAVILSNISSEKKVLSQLKESQAVLDTKYTEKLKQIEKETAVIPKITSDVQMLKTSFAVHEEQIKTIKGMIGGIK